tara:strand:- start:501 stop:614 length:114 start_codon:yes stop_codon:yes gene_type:complete
MKKNEDKPAIKRLVIFKRLFALVFEKKSKGMKMIDEL